MTEPRYQQIAARISEQISQGLYRSGDRLPSVRLQSRRLGVSISTILQAYGVLQDRRLIESRPQSGYFVCPPQRRPDPPATTAPVRKPVQVSISDLAMEVVQANEQPGMVQFGTALPDTDFPAVRRLHRILAGIARQPRPQHASYLFPPGDSGLRLQLARRAVDGGCSYEPDDIVITNGCQEALVLGLRAIARPGDTIAIESPTFYGTLQAIESLGMRALEIPTHPANGISLEALQLAIEQWPLKGLVLTVGYSNPLGYCMPEEKRAALFELLQRHDLPLIEDEVYADLSYDGHRPRAIKSWDRDGRVLLCSSVSKTLDPGLRLGWIIPGRYLKQVQHLKLVSSMASATLPQLALAEYLERGGYDRHLRELRSGYRRNRDRLLDLVGSCFPSGIRITHPQGGFLAWLELPEALDSMRLYQRAMAAGITIAPGALFSPSGKYRNFLRLNYAQPWNEGREAALATLGRLCQQMSDESL